jgi:hypothetical protein
MNTAKVRLPRRDRFMNESNHRVFALLDLVALGESELRQQEAIFTQIEENKRYRQALLALLSSSLRQFSRLRREMK